MSVTRRNALKTLAGGAALCAAPGPAAAGGLLREGDTAKKRIPIAVSTYSYWHFDEVKYPIEDVIEEAAAIGFDGVEILHRQMRDETIPYMNDLKRRASLAGLSLPMLSIHQDFVDPDAAKRQQAIDHTKHCMDLAHQMGIPVIRLNSGRWGTVRSFDELMKLEGQEPPLEGHTDEDAFGWCIDAIERCLPHAEKTGVMMALENHWGLTTDPRNVVKIYQAVGSPWLGVNMDTGNYVGDPYAGIEVLAPHASIVQAKTYYGGGEWYTLDLDYPRIAGILRDAGFGGWVSLEMEGKESPESAVRKSHEVLRGAFS